MERAATLFQADSACLLLRDENAPGLGVHAGRGVLPVAPDSRVMLGEGTFGRLAVEREAALLVGEELPDLAGAADTADGEETGPIASLMVVPLVTADELLGLIVLGAVAEDRFDAANLELLTLAADRMAIAIDHVQRFAHGRQLVETLQRSLLPDRLPHHPRLELAARYLPSGLAPQIGGDWYDALELDRDRTAVMIGDVVGHGVRAATTMSELRNALRAFAVEGHSPGAALQQLDRVVHATFGPGMIATVLFLIIDAAKGTVSISRAGHPPPALRSAGGEIRFLETGNTLPLGIDDRVKADEAEYPVNPGDTLLLFTDGLVERRRESINTGFDRLRDAFATAPADVEELCDYILERTVTEQASHDDIAVLAVRVLGPPLGALQLTAARQGRLGAARAPPPAGVAQRERARARRDGAQRPGGGVVGGVHQRDPPRVWSGRCDVPGQRGARRRCRRAPGPRHRPVATPARPARRSRHRADARALR